MFTGPHEGHASGQDAVDAAWVNEIGRRLDEVLDGRGELVSVAESHAQLRAELAARRR